MIRSRREIDIKAGAEYAIRADYYKMQHKKETGKNMSEKIADVIKETENNKADRQEQYFFRTDQLTVGYDGKPLIREINIQLKKGENPHSHRS